MQRAGAGSALRGRLGSILVVLGLGLLVLQAVTAATNGWNPLAWSPAGHTALPQAPATTGAATADEISISVPLEAAEPVDEEAAQPERNEAPLSGPVSASERLVIPRIGVDSKIADVFLTKGEWPVPKFIVGHLGESVQPGEVGNAVFAGHLLSLSSGNVFARLREMEIGDELTFGSPEGDRRFRVTETRLVANTDVSVLAARPGKTTVTLITCEGTWIPKENDYDKRRIVVAEVISPAV